MTRKIALGVSLALIAILVNINLAAATPNFPNPGGTISFEASPTNIAKGASTDLVVCNGTGRSDMIVSEAGSALTDPLGGAYGLDNSAHGDPVVIPAGECHSWDALSDFPGLSTNAHGTYNVILNTSMGILHFSFSTSFFVTPESPIGALALIGSSMAAFGAFVGIRRYKLRI